MDLHDDALTTLGQGDRGAEPGEPPASTRPPRPAIVERDCPLCGAAAEDSAPNPHSLAEWPLRDCRRCGMVYLRLAPSYGALAGEYAWEKSSAAEDRRRAATEPWLHRLDRATRWRLHLLPRIDMPHLVARHAPKGPVLDVGCGDGGAMAKLRAGYVPHGIEISPVLAERADAAFRQRGGRVVCAPALEEFRDFPSGFFAAVTLRSYLEHEIAPADVLREVHRVLAPGGVAFVKVPNYGCLNRKVRGRRWCGFRHPDHVNYFTPRTLRRMAQGCGFLAAIGVSGAFPLSDNLWARLEKFPVNRESPTASAHPPPSAPGVRGPIPRGAGGGADDR